MNPHYAATRKTINEAAFWYWQMGISIIPCRGKIPNIPAWQQYQQRRATRAELDSWISAGKFNSIGVICGAVSGNLVVMDLDSPPAIATYEQRFPNLLDTYSVVSGSGKGMHLYYQTEKLPKTARVALSGEHHGIELRADGCYVIAPPSIHPDSLMPYRPANDKPVKTLLQLEFVREWIHGMIRQKYQQNGIVPEKPLPVPAVRPGRWMAREEYMRLAYLRSAKDQQIRRITGASVGTRNTALYMSAQCLGQLVGGGELERAAVETALLSAAVTVGLSEIEAQKTIASGIDDGMLNPRRVPPAPSKKA